MSWCCCAWCAVAQLCWATIFLFKCCVLSAGAKVYWAFGVHVSGYWLCGPEARRLWIGRMCLHRANSGSGGRPQAQFYWAAPPADKHPQWTRPLAGLVSTPLSQGGLHASPRDELLQMPHVCAGTASANMPASLVPGGVCSLGSHETYCPARLCRGPRT